MNRRKTKEQTRNVMDPTGYSADGLAISWNAIFAGTLRSGEVE